MKITGYDRKANVNTGPHHRLAIILPHSSHDVGLFHALIGKSSVPDQITGGLFANPDVSFLVSPSP